MFKPLYYEFGKRMKKYESQTCSLKLIDGIPVIARLDGKSFSKFTKDLEKPFDRRFSDIMIELTKYLVKTTNANCGYTQSDEITLVWYNDDVNAQMYYNKIFKILTELSSIASVYFYKLLLDKIPEKSNSLPRFDARVFNVPTLDESINVLVWRESDAIRNSISMAAYYHLSNKSILNKNGKERKEMLLKKGVNWDDYDAHFKRGTYIQHYKESRVLTEDELKLLPTKHNAHYDPNMMIIRRIVISFNTIRLSDMSNKVDFIINGVEPKYII